MQTSEAVAPKRTARAVEKLRKVFSKSGITLTSAIIAGVVSANSVQAAPPALVVAASAINGTGLSTALTTLAKATMKKIAWLKLKPAIAMGLAVLLVGGVATAVRSNDARERAATSVPRDVSMLIVPGESVGPVRKGMTTNEVEGVLGKPDKKRGKMMVYDGRFGMSVSQGGNGVMVIFCGDSALANPGVKKFKGRTKEGIGMESTREAVIQAFGQPDTAKPWNVRQEELDYKELGLKFILESGKVINITVDFRNTK